MLKVVMISFGVVSPSGSAVITSGEAQAMISSTLKVTGKIPSMVALATIRSGVIVVLT